MKENKLVDLSVDFAIKIIKLCETIKGHYSLVNQLERSATSKRSNFCLPKVTSFFIQAAGLVYYQPRRGCISSIALRWHIITA